jgi:hypothetical protein
MLYLKEILDKLLKNTTKVYLVIANCILVIFAIWFTNVGLLPFKSLGDFVFFAVLALILGLYRPGWTFVFFIGTLALENINIAPASLGLSLRPYQFFGSITILAILVQIFSKRIFFSLPKFHWYDAMPILFALGGFLSAFGALNKGASFKQAIIAMSFVALYFLVRIYVQSLEDVKRIVPFFLSSGFIVMIYAVWQNMRFLSGGNAFEIMPGRPNGTFYEADWLGMYLVFLLSTILSFVYSINKNNFSKRFRVLSNLCSYFYVTFIFVVLILTVSRSAWIGALIVVLVFLKSNLLRYYFEVREKKHGAGKVFLEIIKLQKIQWEKTGFQLMWLTFSFGISILLVNMVPLTRFQLANRVVSTSGLQKITVACTSALSSETPKLIPNSTIASLDELVNYGCRHINLEDTEKEVGAGFMVMEVYRPDPNVSIRSVIYRKSIEQINKHVLFGLGWGGISAVLGQDERGAGLNASNIFLEVWLGSGLLGLVSFVIVLGFILVFSIVRFFSVQYEVKSSVALVFVMIGWCAVVFPNLFNSGIFLGFVWTFLAIAVSLLSEQKSS